MEDVMHSLHGERKPEAESMRRDLLNDGKGTGLLEIKFLGRASSLQIARIEPYLISDSEGQKSGTSGFSTGLILSAGDLELLMEEPLDISQTLGQLLSGTRGNRVVGDFQTRVITFICEEGSEVHGRVGSVVIGELRQRQKVIPIVLVIVDIDPQVLLQDLIQVLCLTISLRTISGREVPLDAEKTAERGPEVGHECLATIGNDVGRCAMLREDMAQIQLS